MTAETETETVARLLARGFNEHIRDHGPDGDSAGEVAETGDGHRLVVTRGGVRYFVTVEPDDEPKLCSWADEYENADGACFPRWCGQPGTPGVRERAAPARPVDAAGDGRPSRLLRCGPNEPQGQPASPVERGGSQWLSFAR